MEKASTIGWRPPLMSISSPSCKIGAVYFRRTAVSARLCKASKVDRPTYIETMYLEIVKKIPLVDQVIERAAPKFPITEMNKVDKCILRIAIYELIFGDHKETPPKAAISEGVELARAFSGFKSRKFINGVLATVYTELGLPEIPKVDRTPEERLQHKKEREENMPIEEKVGGMIISVNEGVIHTLLVYDMFGFWTFSKGDKQEGETNEEAVARAIKLECGVDIVPTRKIGFHEYVAYYPDRGSVKKQANYFLCVASNMKTPTLDGASNGIRAIRWFSIDDAKDLRMYEDIIKMMNTTVDSIQKELASDTKKAPAQD